MATRANWKGVLKVGELTCPVALYTATSTSERVSFHLLNRETGHRLHREYVDETTGKPVAAEDQVKGYDTGDGGLVVLEPEEIAAAIPDSDKVLAVATFVACAEIDETYFDRPYFLAPANPEAMEAFLLLRDGMRTKNVAALARTVLFRRLRSLLVRAHDDGLIATTLNFDYEVRSADDAFDEIPARKITGEMLELAQHIIKTKLGRFEPSEMEDRYDTAVADLVKAKLEGRKIARPKQVKTGNVVNLLDALRQSAKGATPAAKKKTAKRTAAKRKAG
jgi:DNA end-binding protein Ku